MDIKKPRFIGAYLLILIPIMYILLFEIINQMN